MSDDDVMMALRNALDSVHLDKPVEKIRATVRRRKHQRLAFQMSVAVGAVGVGIAFAAISGGHAGGQGPANRSTSVNARDVAWTVKTNRDGTISVTLPQSSDLFDPAALQRALRAAGAPAVVVNGNCSWPSVSQHGTRQWLAWRQGRGTDKSGWTLRFTPSALPLETQVVFDIVDLPVSGLSSNLATGSSYFALLYSSPSAYPRPSSGATPPSGAHAIGIDLMPSGVTPRC